MKKNSKNIALTGMMGCGKSTVAKELKTILADFTWVEMDSYLEKKENKSINDIFSTNGEAYFRELESQYIEYLAKECNQIISMGGGAYLKEVNRKNFSKNSFCVYLKASPETIYGRIKDDNSRPLLKSKNVKLKIKEILKKREEIYELADCIIVTDNKTVNEIALEIVEKYKNYGN